jgi:acetyl esterase/lipase
MDPTVLRSFADLYLRGADSRLPLASPVFADLSGLPPLLIQAGSIEVLVDDARALVERAHACKVEVVVTIQAVAAAGTPGGQKGVPSLSVIIRVDPRLPAFCHSTERSPVSKRVSS